MDNNNLSGGLGGNNNHRGQNIIMLLIAALVTILCMTWFLRTMTQSTSSELTYSEFMEMVDQGKVDNVVIEDDRVTIYPKAEGVQAVNPFYGSMGMTYYTGKAEADSILTSRLLEAGVTVSSEVPDRSGVVVSFLFYYVVPILLMWGILSLVFRKMGRSGGIFNVGKNNAKVYVQRETGVTFKDVAGEDEAKESLVEVVDFLHNPGRYSTIGAKLPKGALLVGPPGTGKTLLAKAVAGEAHVPFYSLTGSDFIELYVGVGASRVRDLFHEASRNAPCIIFIDEIDAIGRSRDSRYGGNEEREQTLNQLLSEMDGFDSSKGVLVIGATNRPEILDKALLRPGRFDRRIVVDKPDLKGREEILKVHAKDVKMDETVDLKGIALATSGAVGSDLANMINEAAINAVKDHRELVCQKDLMEAVEQVLVGKEKKDRILSKEERKIVSYHEIGHALVTAVRKNAEPVQKITIVPRTMGALGYVMQVPEDEKYLQTRIELLDEITIALGGRAAEEVIFNTVTTGAENDIEKATGTARAMITLFGMSERFGLMQLESIQNRYLDGRRELNCSDITAAQIDEEVKKILDQCYEEAKAIIRAHLNAMDQLAQFLIERETITGKEFMRIYREVEGIPEPTEEELEAQKEKRRIYATRPESAAVGENVPTRTFEKTDDVIARTVSEWRKPAPQEQQKQEDGTPWQGESQTYAPQESAIGSHVDVSTPEQTSNGTGRETPEQGASEQGTPEQGVANREAPGQEAPKPEPPKFEPIFDAELSKPASPEAPQDDPNVGRFSHVPLDE